MKRLTWFLALVALVLTPVLLTACGEKKEKRDPLAKRMAKDTKMTEEEAESFLAQVDDKVQPQDPAKEWSKMRPGFWGLPRSNGFSTNVNVTSFDNTKEKLTAAEVIEVTKKEMPGMMGVPIDFMDEGSFDYEGDHETRVLEYTTSVSGYDIHGVQYYVDAGDRMYVITGTMLAKEYAKRKNIVASFMKSYDLEHRGA